MTLGRHLVHLGLRSNSTCMETLVQRHGYKTQEGGGRGLKINFHARENSKNEKVINFHPKFDIDPPPPFLSIENVEIASPLTVFL